MNRDEPVPRAPTRMRVADYIARATHEAGLRQVFTVTGGGAMHLNDAFSRARGLSILYMHHEQACAMAAEGYARIAGRAAVVNVTTGPGGINALNGVFGAYTDSVPMVVISGQVKRETIVANQALPLRQLGDQEADIVAMVRGITKFAVLLNDPADARFVMEKAIWSAVTGRPGPVWIDVPVDVQGALIEPEALRSFDPADEPDPCATGPNEAGRLTGAALREAARDVLDRIRAAERPVILPGSGVRLAGAYDLFRRFVAATALPVAPAFNAHDLLPDDHPCAAGRPGTIGDRAGNFAVQNADLVLVLGCRLNIRQISYNWTSFARAATRVMVDIDAAELRKPTLSIDVPIHADLADFLSAAVELAESASYVPQAAHAAYRTWCRNGKARYPAALPEHFTQEGPVNPYAFASLLSDALEEGDIVVTANATATIVTFQTLRLKAGQRLFSNSGSASMGYDLPAAIGACLAAGGRRVVCLAGDGSIMMNLQELQTIAGAGLPIKVFLLNNDGYHSIRQTQHAFFGSELHGCGASSGVSFPDFSKIGPAFGIATTRVERLDAAPAAIAAALATPGPTLCEVLIDPAQPFSPKVSSRRLPDGRMVSAPLEDMAPFLPRDEFLANMLIAPVEVG